MSRVCCECTHWTPSITKGECKKGHGFLYGIECCNYCEDFKTPEQGKIDMLQEDNKRMRELIKDAVEHIEQYDDGMAGWLDAAKQALDKQPA